MWTFSQLKIEAYYDKVTCHCSLVLVEAVAQLLILVSKHFAVPQLCLWRFRHHLREEWTFELFWLYRLCLIEEGQIFCKQHSSDQFNLSYSFSQLFLLYAGLHTVLFRSHRNYMKCHNHLKKPVCLNRCFLSHLVKPEGCYFCRSYQFHPDLKHVSLECFWIFLDVVCPVSSMS